MGINKITIIFIICSLNYYTGYSQELEPRAMTNLPVGTNFLLGGYGYMEEYPMARLLRDSRLGPIGGGTSEILREIIAKIIIDKKDYKPAT
jgi:hypothetical protein